MFVAVYKFGNRTFVSAEFRWPMLMFPRQIYRSHPGAHMSTGTGPALSSNPMAAQLAVQLAQLKARIRVSADWFFWIAGLSIINSIMVQAGGGLHFVVGLGVTEFVDAVVAQGPSNIHVAGWIVNIVIAGVFALFGKFGREGKKGAFLVGMALYAADALLMAKFQIWLGVAFHAYALYRIYLGLGAVNTLESIKDRAAAMGASV
jgi:hypothetical protein